MFLSKLFARREGRRDDTLPTVCYASCIDLRSDVQNTTDFAGKCDEGTSFRDLYDLCVNCLLSVGNNTKDVTDIFAAYFQYCDFEAVQHVTLTASALYVGQTIPIIFTTDVTYNVSALPSTVTTSSADITSTSTLIPTPPTSANSTASSSLTGNSDSNLIPTTEPTTSANPGSGSQAWMAGPVVGSISGVAIVAVGIFLWHRRRTARRKPQSGDVTDKPQLHSDCVPRPPPDELDAGMRHELPGDEPGKWNAPMSELPVDHSTLELKTYGKNELPSYEPEQLPS
ncbi:hypothetical protein E8E14_014940 [Neopestalotiopsis sp. 37M]|nr:hypothetical protein E8E14_014940 [Neopestalotiopsis sp. 37M]